MPHDSIRSRLSIPRLLALVLMGLTTTASTQEPDTKEPLVESPFLAPFVSRELIEVILEDLEQAQVAEERVSGVYLDPDSGILWAAEDNGRDIDWYRASGYCERLELAGFEDWSLPSLEELESLLRPMAKGAYNMPGKFQLTACCPWSSTKKDDQSAWNFNFQFSKPFSGSVSYTYDHRALCMRVPLEEERALIETLLKEAKRK